MHESRSTKKNHSVFAYDSYMITSFLKIDVDEFIEICIDTLTMVPIHKTAARLNCSIKCVFQNRHKFLSMLEKYFCHSPFLL